MVVKDRRKVTNDEVSTYLKAIFERIAQSYGITLIEWNHDKEHVHVLFKSEQSTN